MSAKDDAGRRDFLRAGIAATVAAGATLATESLARAGDPPPPAAASGAEKEGTILRGADGKLYFIPDDSLKAFALDEKKTAALEDRFGDGMKSAVATLPGKEVTDSGVGALKIRNVLLVNVGALRSGGAVGLKAKVVPPAKITPQAPQAPAAPPAAIKK